MGDSIYHVWRRSDGYVGWTRGAQPPEGWADVTFEYLLSTPDEHAARKCLMSEREKGNSNG